MTAQSSMLHTRMDSELKDRDFPPGPSRERRRRRIMFLMAKNTGSDNRVGAVRERVQALNPVTKRYVKIDTSTGRIIDHKKTAGPYKGVREVTTKNK